MYGGGEVHDFRAPPGITHLSAIPVLELVLVDPSLLAIFPWSHEFLLSGLLKRIFTAFEISASSIWTRQGPMELQTQYLEHK